MTGKKAAAGKVKDVELYEILSILKSNMDGPYLSGQTLSKRVKMSRTAVWKIIRKLRLHGYKIESKKALGYKLTALTQLPVPLELASSLRTKFVGKDVRYFFTASSTQDIAIDISESDANPHGTVVIAEKQEKGRGRIGRKWVSLAGGLWLSVILIPKIPVSKSTLLPFVAAVAVCETIMEKFKLDAKLKWPNDVIIDGDKVAGILLEISAEGPKINYAVMGIGVNVNVESSQLASLVDKTQGFFGITSLKEKVGKEINMLEFCKILLEKIEQYYIILEEHDGSEQIIKKWKERAATLGSKVTVKHNDKVLKGIALDVNEEGSLIIKTETGQRETVISGDVFLK